MCAKNHLLIFSSFLDISENVECPRFFGPPCICTVLIPSFIEQPLDDVLWLYKNCDFPVPLPRTVCYKRIQIFIILRAVCKFTKR